MHRLLLLTQHFPPSSEVAAKVMARFLRYLPAHGWQPTVLTVPEAETGAPLDRKAYSDVVNSVRIERVGRWPYLIDALRMARAVRDRFGRVRPNAAVPSRASAGDELFRWGLPGDRREVSLLKRCLMFPDGRAGWVAPVVLYAWRMMAREPFDAVLTVSPPHSTHLAGLALRRLLPSVPWIAHLHDPWVSLHKEADSLIRRSLLALERRCMNAADEILFATDEALEGYISRYPGLPREKMGVLPNGYDPTDFPNEYHGTRAPGEALRFVHIGTMYGGRDPRPFLRGLSALMAAGALTPADVRIDFIGDVETKGAIEQAIEEAGLGCTVSIPGLVDYPEALRRMLSADVLLLFAQGQPHQIPAKLYEYLNAARFVLAFTDGASARVIEEVGAGRVIGPRDDVADVANALGDVLALHRAGRLNPWHVADSKLRQYQSATLAERLAARLDRLTESRRRTRPAA